MFELFAHFTRTNMHISIRMSSTRPHVYDSARNYKLYIGERENYIAMKDERARIDGDCRDSRESGEFFFFFL